MVASIRRQSSSLGVKIQAWLTCLHAHLIKSFVELLILLLLQNIVVRSWQQVVMVDEIEALGHFAQDAQLLILLLLLYAQFEGTDAILESSRIALRSVVLEEGRD